VIAVYSGDRGWRLALEKALRAQGVTVRTASRPAELAKSLADGVVRVVLVGPTADDHADADRVVSPSLTVIRTSPGESTEDVVRRAMALC